MGTIRWRRGAVVAAAATAVLLLGTGGFYAMGGGDWGLMTCVYMTVVTLSTVGYGEVIPIAGHPEREAFTMVLLVLGMGTTFYALSTAAAFVIEGALAETVKTRRMKKLLSQMAGHFIVCGAGRSGSVTIRELVNAGFSVVAIDRDEQLLSRLPGQDTNQVLTVVGDATEDEILHLARIDSATGLVCALSEDRDNLFITVSARQLNPDLRIVSKSLNDPRKIERAGADAVVWVNAIGGHRLFSELVRPREVNLIEELLLDPSGLSVSEVVIRPGAVLAGQPIGSAFVRERTNVIFAATRCADTSVLRHNPSPDTVLEPGLVVVAMGLESELEVFRHQATAPRSRWPGLARNSSHPRPDVSRSEAPPVRLGRA